MSLSPLLAVARRLASTMLVGVLGGALLAAPTARAVALSVEQTFGRPGPWAVSTLAVDTSYVIHYPSDLGANGVRRPIVTWGNGSWATPAQYPGVLNQLASWGFVVIASTSSTTGKGTEMLAAVDYLAARNNDPTSIFAGRLDTARIAAAGHSQGAGGAARATLAAGGRITTVVPINPPDPFWVNDADRFDVSQVTVPVLLLSGVGDTWISPPRTLTAYYRQITGAVARASLKGADHNTIQGTGGGYLGYLTAWLRYQLLDDQHAGAAFRGAQPELLTNPLWANQAAKNLP
ncbi:MAG TPA: hypothetical protein VF755_05995 [Catenuloplanes sp.]